MDDDRSGLGQALVVEANQYDSLMETAEILVDTDFADQLRASINEADAGNLLNWDDVRASLGL